jgi:hypothetical protein
MSELENRLNKCEQKCGDSPTEANFREFEISKLEYESYHDYITQGAMIRYHSKSCIRKIHLKNSSSISCDPEVIMKEVEDFYSSLYRENPPELNKNVAIDFYNSPDMPLLTEEQKTGCEGKLTKNECFKALLTTQNGKTPGIDGLNAEFYKCFWPLLGELVVNSLNEAYEKGELSTSQK